MESVNSNWWGMHTFWWIFWLFLLVIVFFTPWGYSKRSSRSSLLHALRKTYAEEKISTQEFEERKRVLENEFLNQREKGASTKDANQ
jgi:putative membrane protein